MSGGIVPSKSTLYVSNLPFSLTNNDLHKIFEKFGTVVKITIMKDKQTRKSRGVAFVQFLKKEDAKSSALSINGHEMFGRMLKASIAVDNGRSADYIRRKNYPDKSKCYECGEEGHLSYLCPKNALGERAPPPKKKKRKGKASSQREDADDDVGSGSEDDARETRQEGPVLPDDETLSAAIQLEQEKVELDHYRYQVVTGKYEDSSGTSGRKRIRPNEYFSDEEEDLSE